MKHTLCILALCIAALVIADISPWPLIALYWLLVAWYWKGGRKS